MPSGYTVAWTPEMDILLGTMPDWEVAVKLGIHKGTVRLRRNKLGVPARYPKVVWTPEMDTLLGTVIDKEAARRLGISKDSVFYRRRRELDIPPFGRTSKIEWTPEADALLGTAYDKDVASQLGISQETVIGRRCKLGIASYKKSNRVTPEGASWLEAKRWRESRRRCRKRDLSDTLTYEQWKSACEWFDDHCAYCGQEVFLTEDHLVPLSKGGPRTVLNIIPACFACNSSKRAKQAHKWIYEHFGMEKGRRIVERIVAYLTEVEKQC